MVPERGCPQEDRGGPSGWGPCMGAAEAEGVTEDSGAAKGQGGGHAVPSHGTADLTEAAKGVT